MPEMPERIGPYRVLWLDALRARAEFTDLLRKSQQLHREASTAFLAGGGPELLGIRSEGY